jgi:glutamyl-tRNA reductase
MKLLSLGIDHQKTTTTLRESLAFDGARRHAGLESLRVANPGCEHVVLSTCNRVEIYLGAADTQGLPEPEEVASWLARFHGLSDSALRGQLVAHRDEAVVRHLFRVASSLESLVLGEGQILGQVRDAYHASVERGVVGPMFHALFQRALRVGKRVREETGLDQGRLSIASIAVELAQSVFDNFQDKTVLVIGAGKMGDLTLQHLNELRPGRVLIANRDFERACESSRRWNAEAVPFERLDDTLVEADLVISTTSAQQPIVTLERYTRLQRKQRGGRLALILDIAVPRDFDPRIGELDQVLLYNIDDLRLQVERNLGRRQTHIAPALAIIEAEADQFFAEARQHAEAGALIRQLGDYGDGIAARELERFFASCPELSEEQRRAAEHLVHRLKNQFLHHPRAALRSAFGVETQPPQRTEGELHPLVLAVRCIFGLRDADNPHDRKP